MTSNRALKVDNAAKLKLINQIEAFSMQHGISLADLYDKDDLENVFIPKLKELELLVSASEKNLRLIDDLGSRWWKISSDIRRVQRASIMPSHWMTFADLRKIYDHFHKIHYIEAQRKSNFRRRAWEIRVFIERCTNYNHHRLLDRLTEMHSRLTRIARSLV